MKIRFSNLFLSFFFISASILTVAQTDKKTINLEDIYKNRKFSSKGVYGIQSLKDGEHYYQLKKDSLNVYEYATGKLVRTVVISSQLIPAGDTVAIPLIGFEFSEDETKILFANDEEPIYRRSSKASYYVFDLTSGKLLPLSMNGKQRLATFSHDGTKVAFVSDNNIFITDLSSVIRDLSSVIETQVTTDGKINGIINGASDWVYEEEFEFSKAFSWSSDGRSLAFYRFDETNVKEYELTYYGDTYPEQYKFKYPKAGESNSVIEIYIYNLKSKKTIPVDIGKETNIYIPRIKWTEDPNILAIYRMNRHQNKLELLLAASQTGKTNVIYTEENKYYIEVNDHWHFFKNNRQFLLSSEKDGYRHIYLYHLNGTLIRQVTQGKWEVSDILGIDEKTERVFYTSTESSPLEKDLFSIGLDGSHKVKLSSRAGTNSAEFSRNFAWYLGRWSDINTPPYIAIFNVDGKEIRMMQDNAKLRETMKEYQYSKAEFFTCKTSDSTILNGMMVKPPDFDPARKYPVLFSIYGGPGSQTVLNGWGTVSSWNQLWAQHGIIVVSVDNRGTGGRGEEFKKCTYLQLGKYETLDQIEAAKYMGTLPYVDKNRIGM